MERNAHRSRSISNVSSFSTVYVFIRFYPIRVRALYVEKPQLGSINSAYTIQLGLFGYTAPSNGWDQNLKLIVL